MTDDRINVLERIDAQALIQSWRQDFDIDVSHLFAGVDEIDLRVDPESGHLAFSPTVLGDAAFYQELRRFKWYHPRRKQEHVYAAIHARSDGLVLDVGAGNGDFAAYLQGVDYLGLERDAVAIAKAQDRGLDLRDVSMSAWRTCEDYRPASLVTAFQVLEHVADPLAFVRDMAACVQRDGDIVIGVPDADSYVTSLPDFMLNAPPHHVSWWTEATLTKLLLQAGLEVVEVKRFPVEPWEYQLWWMAKFARVSKRSDRKYFGAHLRWRKVLSFCASWPLQWVPPPKSALGSTLLVKAVKRA